MDARLSEVRVEPWPDINPICDDRIGRLHDKSGVPINMGVTDGKITISAPLTREALGRLLAEAGITVLDK